MSEAPDRHVLAHAIEVACRAIAEPQTNRPLPGLDAGQVADHLVEVAEAFADELGAAPPGGPVPDDRPGRFGVAMSRVLDVWDEPDRQRPHPDLEAGQRRWVLVCELVVHAWDLGAHHTWLPPGAALACIEGSASWIDHYRGSGTIMPAVPTPSKLPLEQLAAFFGRPIPDRAGDD